MIYAYNLVSKTIFKIMNTNCKTLLKTIIILILGSCESLKYSDSIYNYWIINPDSIIRR